MISLTPLIDVVFILLLFFMLSSSFLKWQQINLSAPVENDDQVHDYKIIHLLSNDGAVQVDSKPYLFNNLQTITTFVTKNSGSDFVITAEPEIYTQTVVSLLDRLKTSGALKVSIAGVAE